MQKQEVLDILRPVAERTVDGQPNHDNCIIFRGTADPRPGDAAETEVEMAFKNAGERDQVLAVLSTYLGVTVTPVASRELPYTPMTDIERTSPEAVLIRGEPAERIQELVLEGGLSHKFEKARSRGFADTYPAR